MSAVDEVWAAAEQLRRRTMALSGDLLAESGRIDRIYHPLDYARRPHEAYIERFAGLGARLLLVGMNPGHGMGNTGVPFGCPEQVRDYLGIRDLPVGKPVDEHPKRPVSGLACPKAEVSGRRIWTFLRERWGSPEEVHGRIYIVNHCPLWMFDEAGRNITPDKLSGAGASRLAEACDKHLRSVAEALRVTSVIGVGRYAHSRLPRDLGFEAGYVPHPSPASPFANRNGGADWRAAFAAALTAAGLAETVR